ncbi:uncharacterized protein LOC134436227 isoform X2 [Engraulis encrasicolus]|uniref:uncharacterized protein LOC134436227 isoform X2 n=1 Tax=Engraulis encrasicolus TaxID=184585 RepID=UPI002FD0B827
MCNQRGEEWDSVDAIKLGPPWVNGNDIRLKNYGDINNNKKVDNYDDVEDPRAKIPHEGDAAVTPLTTHGMVACTCLDPNILRKSILHNFNTKAGKATRVTRSRRSVSKRPVTAQRRPQSPTLTWALRKRHVQRSARKVCCNLCGVTKYSPPQRRKLAPVNRLRLVLVDEEDYLGLRRVSGSQRKPRKLVIWLRRYPKVRLCDISQVFDISPHFSCLVPPSFFPFVQKSGLHCFKQQVLALMCQEHLGDGSSSSYERTAGADAQVADASCHHTCEDDNGCQRVRPFVRRNRYLCSRTYLTWPFVANAPPPCVLSPPRSPTKATCASSPNIPCRGISALSCSSVGEAREQSGRTPCSSSLEAAVSSSEDDYTLPHCQNGDVCELSHSPPRGDRLSPEKPSPTPLQSSQVIEDPQELVSNRVVENGHADVVPSLESPPASHDGSLTHKPLIFHQSGYDLSDSESPQQGDVFKTRLYRSLLSARPQLLSPIAEHGPDSGSGESSNDGVTSTLSSASSLMDFFEEGTSVGKDGENDGKDKEVVDMETDAVTPSSLDLFEEQSPRDENGENDNKKAMIDRENNDRILDSTEEVCDIPEAAGVVDSSGKVCDKPEVGCFLSSTGEVCDVSKAGAVLDSSGKVCNIPEDGVVNKTGSECELSDRDAFFDSSDQVCDRTDPVLSQRDSGVHSRRRRRHLRDLDSVAANSCEFEAYQQDALVLDVIDDDPYLFGCMMPEKEEEEDDEPESVRSDSQRSSPSFYTARSTSTEELSSSASNFKRHTEKQSVKAKVKSHNLQEDGPKDQMTTEGSTSSQSMDTSVDMDISPESPHDYGDDGYHEDWSSDLNPEASNTKPESWSKDRFTHLKNGVPPRPPPRPNGDARYCRYYFSDKDFCYRKMCGFLHVPRKGDEKFCMVIVERFARSNNPVYVTQAVDVFTRYYEACHPGLCFNVEVVTTLLDALLRLSLFAEMLSILNLLLAHNIRPPADYLITVFKTASMTKQHNAVSQLISVLSKSVEAGCLFSMGQCEELQKCLELLAASKLHMDMFLAVKCRALANVCDGSDMRCGIAYAFVDVELCRKQEDWPGLADIFLRMCASPCTSSHLLRFCMALATALLVEPSQSPTPPYVTFAEKVSTQVLDEGLDRSFLGRIGISMMVHYYNEKQWEKGQRIVAVLSQQQPCYSGLKGVFKNEETLSRCRLITMATELPLHCGKVEVALNVLRDNNWFVSDSVWPCEPEDVCHRVSVQKRLAQATSNRDTLEVLAHLPGLLPPQDVEKAREYTCLFNSLIRTCLEMHTLLVGADTLEYLLANGMQAEMPLVQNLICELGKRNMWQRARILFQCAMKEGYYPLVDVSDKQVVLELPCYLNKVEMAVCLEMFISRCLPDSTQNPSKVHAPMVILKRESESGVRAVESVYLAAGCTLLSSAQLLNPKLRLSYTITSGQQQQVYTIDPGSAHKWLHGNSSWACKLWPV